MAETTIANVQVPERYANYIVELSTSKSALWTSGIVGTDPRISSLASGGGTTINLPYWDDLTGNSEVLETDGDLTPDAFSSDVDVARKNARGKAWASQDLAGEIAGDDPLEALANRIAEWWARDMQDTLIDGILAGVFLDTTGTLFASHVNDISAVGDGVVDAESFIDTLGLLGDAEDKLTGMLMHSAMARKLKKLDLIDFEPESEQGEPIAYYMNKRVIIDDKCPVDGGVYDTYIFGQGAIAYAEAPCKNAFETERDGLGGVDNVINRRHFYLHPRGVAWQEDTVANQFPTNAELATAANWSQAYSDKNVRMVCLRAKASA